MKRNRTHFLLPGLLLGAFLLWTAGVCLVDVRLLNSKLKTVFFQFLYLAHQTFF